MNTDAPAAGMGRLVIIPQTAPGKLRRGGTPRPIRVHLCASVLLTRQIVACRGGSHAPRRAGAVGCKAKKTQRRCTQMNADAPAAGTGRLVIMPKTAPGKLRRGGTPGPSAFICVHLRENLAATLILAWWADDAHTV